MKQTFFILFFIALTSCNNEIKFNKTGWTEMGDLGIYPNRDKMLKDLTENYKLKGLTYRQLIEQIGEPEKNIIGDSNTVYYNILTDFGSNIDPSYSKTLELKFNVDSVVTDYKIDEIKH